MGTNYYLGEKDPCRECGRPYEQLHIGKSSFGWHFSLHVIPEMEINNLEDWKKVWKGKKIFDEYGLKISWVKMLSIITERKGTNNSMEKPYGYESWEEFHKVNHSEFGINGLIRSKIGSFCIGHGEGTYDYKVGYFS